MPKEDVHDRLRAAATAGNLVVVLGTGVSLALHKGSSSVLSWRGLVEDGLQYALNKGCITPEQQTNWRQHLDSNDIYDLLGAAEFVGRKLGAPAGHLYARWLEQAFGRIAIENASGMANCLRALRSHDIPIATVNYDTLAEDVLGCEGIELSETDKVIQWLRRERNTSLLHLHGVWRKPASCVLGIRDYQAILSDEVRDLAQRALGALSQLLFVGCGNTFSDPNFNALTQWMRTHLQAAAPQHYALVTDAEFALIPLLREGKVLLLVDGLDEIHSDANRTAFAEHLEAFLDEYPRTRLLVTSREAGFDLVAPCISRFCDRWRIAPLSNTAIRLLCEYWHNLMSGGTQEADSESDVVASNILNSPSLRHLAENPLLLTMLLVVKHGAGKLPPDRVSLYGRAAEVLLDTWNIKGHDALNLKEAVPQLASVAFDLTATGRQTATERELLEILESARDKLPQIRRYAQGTPHEFLKRVELRSSLLVEAGHKLETSKAVPFYQFRHLTFQEYLAAVAVAEGHHLGYRPNETILTPLQGSLLDARWKEVIPMAAVLAGKQAEPLLNALVVEGCRERELYLAREADGKNDSFQPELPPATDRLLQCLSEEAEPAPETLNKTLDLLAFFSALSLLNMSRWRLLAQGPYGEELRHKAWLYYRDSERPRRSRYRFSLVRLSSARISSSYWRESEGRDQLLAFLKSRDEEEIVRGLSICVGEHFGGEPGFDTDLQQALWPLIEQHVLSGSDWVWPIATWAWALIGRRDPTKLSSPVVLGKTLERLDQGDAANDPTLIPFTFATRLGAERSVWTPTLSPKVQELILSAVSEKSEVRLSEWDVLGYLSIAFHARAPFSDAELRRLLVKSAKRARAFDDELERQARQVLAQLTTSRKARKK